MTSFFKGFIAVFFLLLISSTSHAEIFVISKKNANVRLEPTTKSPTLLKAHKDDWFVYLGSNPDNKWRQVELPDGRPGWIYRTLGRVEDDNYIDTTSPLAPSPTPDGEFTISRLEIHTINVKQGDSTLIVAYDVSNNKRAILFDAGKPNRGNQFVVPYLKSLGLSQINYVISSHLDSDHTGGLDEVLDYDSSNQNDYQIKLTGKAYIPKGDVSSSQKTQYDEYAAAVKRQTGEPLMILAPPTFIPFADGIKVQVVTGGGEYIDNTTNTVVDLEPSDANAKSIGLMITYNKFKFFVAGDLGGQSKHKYIENKVASYVGDIDVLRVSHHGSNTSSHEPFLSIVKPEATLISTGSDNNYGHPRKQVIERLKQSSSSIKIYQTDEGDKTSQYKDLVSFEGRVSGNIVVSTDGNCTYTIKGDGAEFSGTDTFTNDDC